MEVREIMSSPVVTVGVDATLDEAVETMLAHRVGSVLVVDDGLVGIVTESDILAAVFEAEATLSELAVAEVMSSELVTTTSTTSVKAAIRTMEVEGVKRLPIRGGTKPLGIVTLTDIAWHLPDRLRERPGLSTRRQGQRRDGR
ncbi:putative signal-transduction protein containing cAMP-binding and CBS domains [Halovivax ruber XH-70]|uniref:Putative signal-transduction protein containing cAMP-binding and CBS domains n=1 Tax=Halovivax ruber (strain DSM 18193 / JCM 13892 / XH-70) TaxID=797302 RepID=L0I566_HALRX|nr:CBS domain-containing protein [Halovivax ruber]AGB14670.1 putative signal-transduction protein containing cAMP-binding and CBS domains [Halovivax ruber XH-70]